MLEAVPVEVSKEMNNADTFLHCAYAAHAIHKFSKISTGLSKLLLIQYSHCLDSTKFHHLGLMIALS